MIRVLLLLSLAGLIRAQLLTPVWVEGGDGRTIARVVVASAVDCPELLVDGTVSRMRARQPVPDGLRPACEAEIPAGAKSASVKGQTLALPKPDPSRIVAIGDTGCRVKGPRVQDCNDPAKWPFETVSSRAAEAKPELVIHVGDYLYREDICPQDQGRLCGGTPNGDRWETWNADFFKPAAKLLAAAPWIFARGNHEDCGRSWRGWFYYLDPRPFSGSCQSYSAPYVAKLGGFEVAVLDTSAAIDDKTDPRQIALFASQLHSLNVHNAWLVDHHPFWSMRPEKPGAKPSPLSVPLEAAWEKADPKGIDLVLSGHTHLFEIISFDYGRPPQLVAGDGGTDLAPGLPASVNGMKIHGLAIAASQTRREFGYTLFNRVADGWALELKAPSGATRVSCRIAGNRVIFPE